MRNILLFFVVFGLLTQIKSQTNDCLKDFDFLVQKIKVDYPGYQDKVTAKSMQELILLENNIRNKIQTYPDSCGNYLNEYTSWFKDNHLRVRRIQSSSNSNIVKMAEPVFLNVAPKVINELESKNNTIEGIWHSFSGDIAILKDSKAIDFIAISISYRNTKKYQVMFRFSPEMEDEFKLTSYSRYNNNKPQSGKASLRLQNNVLEIHDDTRFVRKSNFATLDDALLYSYLPEFPNGTNTYPLAFSLSDSTFYLRISSFMDNDAELLTKKHWQEITTRPNLIIDIRYNGGGQDNYYQILTDLIYDKPYESKGVEWYATENNIRMFEESLKKGEIRGGEEGIRWTNVLLDEMRNNKDKFVIHPMMGADKTITQDTIYSYPNKVGIIINEGNASSAEQFLLAAKESTKTILFGNCNTAGVLDYSNAVAENLPSNEFKLTFPMTRSRRLPEHPIDNIGIAPDVIIPYPSTEQLFDRLDQWVYFVKNYLELMKTNE